MPTPQQFEDLGRLRNHLAALRLSHAPTLENYISRDRHGFYHQLTSKQEASRSSTSTCVASLVNAGLWTATFPLWEGTHAVAGKLLEKPWKSAGLEVNNPFSIAFIIEGVLDLQVARPDYEGAAGHLDLIRTEIAPTLAQALKDGSISIKPYPSSAYLTQLAFRVLGRLDMATPEITRAVQSWSRHEVNKQIALISARSRVADPLQLAYALILATTTASDATTSPEDKQIFDHALSLFFREQNEDGSWPASQPLFHYPTVGNAYCFDCELLTQLLAIPSFRSDLLPYIAQLARAAYALDRSKFDLDKARPGAILAWASGHHPQIEGPESWSTASVYDFAHGLDRLVAEAIRRAVFEELGAIYKPPVPARRPKEDGTDADFAADFLDADLVLEGGDVLSLRDTIARSFVFPIAGETEIIAQGRSFSRRTPMSAILFGPPGTSKTQLAKIISSYIGWPLVSVDPSYLVQEGLDRIQAMANRLFSMLAMTEQVVVLLDEFDEMGRDRTRSRELLSRFITTAMLPKLATINEQRKIVFLLATNYVSGFDAAFSRGGRFDMLIQVMPPNTPAKLKRWPALKACFDKLSEEEQQALAPKVGSLTYLETEQLVARLRPDVDFAKELEEAWSTRTLAKVNEVDRAPEPTPIASALGDDVSSTAPIHVTWEQTSSEERRQIRLPKP